MTGVPMGATAAEVQHREHHEQEERERAECFYPARSGWRERICHAGVL